MTGLRNARSLPGDRHSGQTVVPKVPDVAIAGDPVCPDISSDRAARSLTTDQWHNICGEYSVRTYSWICMTAGGEPKLFAVDWHLASQAFLRGTIAMS